MPVAVITGSCGLVGSEAVDCFCKKGFDVAGIDNNMRGYFFGKEGDISWNKRRLLREHKNYRHFSVDVRDETRIPRLFKKYSKDIKLIIHAASQPSHDWAVRDPTTDFGINAIATVNLLESVRLNCPGAVFVFVSTNKVYGNRPNTLEFTESKKRFDLKRTNRYYNGIDESMSVDNCLHSIFGASKLTADILTQEYGKYFGLKTAVFRCGCVTGRGHSGVELHGFLSYLVRCALTGRRYVIYGYKGKQVRDNIHSRDLVDAFYRFFKKPAAGEVYNIGGGRSSNISVLEAIEMCEKLTCKPFFYDYVDKPRIGDHKWWISDVSKFKTRYPGWKLKYGIKDMLIELIAAGKERFKR